MDGHVGRITVSDDRTRDPFGWACMTYGSFHKVTLNTLPQIQESALLKHLKFLFELLHILLEEM